MLVEEPNAGRDVRRTTSGPPHWRSAGAVRARPTSKCRRALSCFRHADVLARSTTIRPASQHAGEIDRWFFQRYIMVPAAGTVDDVVPSWSVPRRRTQPFTTSSSPTASWCTLCRPPIRCERISLFLRAIDALAAGLGPAVDARHAVAVTRGRPPRPGPGHELDDDDPRTGRCELPPPAGGRRALAADGDAGSNATNPSRQARRRPPRASFTPRAVSAEARARCWPASAVRHLSTTVTASGLPTRVGTDITGAAPASSRNPRERRRINRHARDTSHASFATPPAARLSLQFQHAGKS